MRFEDIQTIQKNVTDVLKDIPEMDFKHALEWLVERSQKCTDMNGVYRRCHKKISYVLNYAFFTLLHKWDDRGHTHRLEKLQ